MQDELLLRRWNDAHDRFPADMHAAFHQLGTRLERPFAAIRRVYNPALRGALAGAITIGLWTSVLALASPPAPSAEALRFDLAGKVVGPAELV